MINIKLIKTLQSIIEIARDLPKNIIVIRDKTESWCTEFISSKQASIDRKPLANQNI